MSDTTAAKACVGVTRTELRIPRASALIVHCVALRATQCTITRPKWLRSRAGGYRTHDQGIMSPVL